MWNIYRSRGSVWNKVITAISYDSDICEGEAFDRIDFRREPYIKRLASFGTEYEEAKEILNLLLNDGLLKSFSDDGKKISLAYKNEQVKKCLLKAGQVLEMKVLSLAKRVTDEEDRAVYCDCVNGAVIDWDGEFHDERVESEVDVENEIDVLLMHGIVPVFVSCKNGRFDSDELYKLNTVSERFGGPYAKKVIVTTALSGFGKDEKYIRERAEEMGIRIVDDIHLSDDEENMRKIKSFWSN